MLDDLDIEKICHGRIVWAEFYTSSGRDSAGPHPAVILDDNDYIKDNDSYHVAVISHNDEIDSKFLLPIPPRTGLTGFIVCSWLSILKLPGITKIGPLLLPPEMGQVLRKIRNYRIQKK